MSSPCCQARFQASVRSRVAANDQRGVQPSSRRALLESSANNPASWGCTWVSTDQRTAVGHNSASWPTMVSTVATLLLSGRSSRRWRISRRPHTTRGPASGSPSAARARAATGVLRGISAGPLLHCFCQERKTSGINRSGDQSPPPITLPARAVASAAPDACKKELR